MKNILVLFLLFFTASLNAQFQNTQTVGSKSTLYKSIGGISADSGLIILNVFADTATANFSVVSRYNSFIRVGTNLYFRTLNPNKWNLLLSGTSSGFITPSDTTAMLSNYMRDSDTATLVANRLKISDTATMLQRGWLSNRSKDSTAVLRALINSKGGGSVTSVATNTGTGIAGGTITSTGTLRIDTLNISTRLWRQKGIDSTVSLIVQKVNIIDTAPMLNTYLRKVDTSTLSNRINLKLNISDSLLGGYTTWALTKKKVDSLGALIGGGGSGTVTSIATNNGSGITGGTITTSGTIAADTSVLSTKANVTALLLGKLNLSAISGTANYLSKYATTTTLGNSQVFDNGTIVAIGGTSGSSLFNVIGQQSIINTTTYSSGTASALGISANTTFTGTLPTSNVSHSAAIANFYTTFNGNTTVGGDNPFGAFLPSNKIDFSSTGTVTMSNGTSGGLKSISAVIASSFDDGTINGTVTKTSGMQINGIFKITGATAVITRTNHYQLLINDTNEFGNGGNITNKWGVYQIGASDTNLFNGGFMLPNLPVYADNTAASSLATGTLYRTSTGVVMVKY